MTALNGGPLGLFFRAFVMPDSFLSTVKNKVGDALGDALGDAFLIRKKTKCVVRGCVRGCILWLFNCRKTIQSYKKTAVLG